MKILSLVAVVALAASPVFGQGNGNGWGNIFKTLGANGTACLNAVANVTATCGGITIPGFGGDGGRDFSRRQTGGIPLLPGLGDPDNKGNDDGKDAIGKMNSTTLERVCSATCQASLNNATATCTAFIKGIPGLDKFPGNLNPADLFASFNIYDSFLCTKDSKGTFCALSVLNTTKTVADSIANVTAAAVMGNATGITPALNTILDGVCTECTMKLLAAWAAGGSNKGPFFNGAFNTLSLACSKNPSGAYCLTEIAAFAKQIVNASIPDAAAAAKKALCNSGSSCIGNLAKTLKSIVSPEDSVIPLKVFTAPDLCAISNNATNATCLDEYAGLANSTPACIKALKAAKGNLNCNTIPQECKDLLTKAVNAGCCAPFIVQALGGPLPNLMACNMTFKPPMCAAPKPAAVINLNITIPNLNFGKLKDYIKNVTDAVIRDVAKQFNLPMIAVMIKEIKGDNKNGTVIVIVIGFPSVQDKDAAKSSANGAMIPLPETAAALQANPEVLNNGQAGVTASLDSAADSTGTGTGNGGGNTGGNGTGNGGGNPPPKGDASPAAVPGLLMAATVALAAAFTL